MVRLNTAIAFAGLVIYFTIAAVAQTPTGALERADSSVSSQPQILHNVDSEQPAVSRDRSREVFETVFDCSGSIMHQSYQGEVESRLAFWFGVDGDGNVSGEITAVGAPLSLPHQPLSGKFEGEFDRQGRFTGGRMTVAWPYSNLGRPVELALMRETFIRVGRKVNGIGRILRRASNHTYVAGRLYFDPVSYPTLKSLYRISFISATCFPENGLPKLASALTLERTTNCDESC